MKLAKANLTKQLQLGAKDMKRQIALQKYHELGEALVQFSRRIREAHGAVSRDLLESFAMTLRNEVKKDYFALNQSSKRRLLEALASSIRHRIPSNFGGQTIHTYELLGQRWLILH